MKKMLKWLGIIICLLVVVVILGVTLFGGEMVKGAVNGFGPMVMGVPVTLEKASFRPLTGRIKLTNLHVGNPNGFKTPALFDLGEVEIELNGKSLFSDTIVIHKIAVVAPHITYEKSLLDSNFTALMKQLEGDTKKKPEGEPVDAKTKKGGKKVVIDELVITDPALNVSITAAGGHYIPVKLGKIELKDIGKEHGGVTFAEATKIIFSVIASNVENAVLGVGDLIGSGAKAVGGAVVGGVSSVISGVGGLLGGEKKKPDENKQPSDR
ncbi:MAG: AsmA family protein [bacterium]